MIQNKKKYIQIETFKNKKKTKKNIKVTASNTYQELLAKISKTYTSKPFKLLLRSQNGLSYQVLTKQLWNEMLKRYAGQQLHILTTQNLQQSLSEIITYQRPHSFKSQQMINEIFKEAKDYLANFFLKKLNQSQPIIKTEKANNSFQCCQCHKMIKEIYYKCLLCKECILCESCEQKESFSELRSHKFRSHPFVKVRPQTSEIDPNLKIRTLKPAQIKFNYQNQTTIKQMELLKKEQNDKRLRQVINIIMEQLSQQK